MNKNLPLPYCILALLILISTVHVHAQVNFPVSSCEFLKKIGGATSANGAEISAFDPSSNRVYTVAGPIIEYFNMSPTGALVYAGALPTGFTSPAGTTAIPNSV